MSELRGKSDVVGDTVTQEMMLHNPILERET